VKKKDLPRGLDATEFRKHMKRLGITPGGQMMKEATASAELAGATLKDRNGRKKK